MDHENTYNTTVMFIDIAGYTNKTSKLSRAALKTLLEAFEKVVTPSIKDFGGKIIKGMGDAYLATFHSPTNALLCGTEIQKKIKERNDRVQTPEQFQARVGISSGEVYERGGDIFGEPVNLASRMQGAADKGQVVFSDATFHLMNKNELSYMSLGKMTFKGIEHEVNVYAVGTEKGNILKKLKYSRHTKTVLIAAGVAIAILLIFMAFSGTRQEPINGNTTPGTTLGPAWEAAARTALQNNNRTAMQELLANYNAIPQGDISLTEKSLADQMNKVLNPTTTTDTTTTSTRTPPGRKK